MRAFLLGLLLLLPLPAAMAQQLGGYTHMIYDVHHGTQVEYLAEGGMTFLWYPGNRVVLEGRWKRQGDDICFRYGGNTYNPATGQQGGGWDCMPFGLYWEGIRERMPGDPFALATRVDAPFRLDRKQTTLDRLLSRASS